MRVDLIPFQQRALGQLRIKLNSAFYGYRNDGLPQILSFTAPTGAGKTIIMAALVESVFNGDELYIHAKKSTAVFEEMSDVTFLWLSDSPELNEQSKLKFELKADRLKIGQCVIIDDSFKGECLEDGHVYFLNTQKLGVNSNLTKHSDTRQHTIWEVLSNTVEKKGERFIVIIDEAHRGAQGREIGRAQTIMQKFIKGSEGELPKMPIVIGMSATIERFTALAGTSDSTLHSIRVTPDEVRSSGLLKDRIIIKYPDDDGSNRKIAVLQAAAQEWKDKCSHWNLFCQEQHHAAVKPIFIIQVENGTQNTLTATNLDDCVLKIEEATGMTFEKGEIVHTFGQTTETLRANGLEIPYLEPSKISDDMKVKVVFFKENLSTGWDCPRAETMVSFKHAQDSTYIAQLLGRVIRTPIHARVTADQTLNDVHLFLPFFDADTVESIVNALNSSETGIIPTEIYGESMSGGDIKCASVRPDSAGREIPLIHRSRKHTELSGNLFSPENQEEETLEEDVNPGEKLPGEELINITWKEPEKKNDPSPTKVSPAENTPKSIPSTKKASVTKYSRKSIIEAINQMDISTCKVREIKMESYLVCLLNLSGLLTRAGLYQNAKLDVQKEISDTIHNYIENLKKNKNYDEMVQNVRSFKMHTRYFDAFGKAIDAGTDKVSLFNDDSNIEIQFRAANATLGKSGIGEAYGKYYGDDNDDTSYMVDVILFANDSAAIEDLNKYAKDKFFKLNSKFRCIVANNCSEAIVSEYKKIVANSDEVSSHPYHLPLDIVYVSDSNGREYSSHLYVDSVTGTIKLKLGSSWEEQLIDEEAKDPNFLCWLKNPPRKEWSLAIPYTMNGVKKTTYPDFVVVKKDDYTNISVDILEPHDPTKTDNLPKAKGFAKFAKENPQVHSIQLIRQFTDNNTGKPTFRRLDLSDLSVQNRINLANNDEDLARIFEEDSFEADYK